MRSKKGYLLVEGHGELKAAGNLVCRLWKAQGVFSAWADPLRWNNAHQWVAAKGGVQGGAEFIRRKADAGALLILRDEDDLCPKETAPKFAGYLRGLGLPFPTAYVLFKPEYEVLFLPCLSFMPRLANAVWQEASWEAKRGVKEWLCQQLPRTRPYKPTVDQLEMTRCLDFETLRQADVPCFGTLERALGFLGKNFGQAGGVYP